jgi:hypothetical protein
MRRSGLLVAAFALLLLGALTPPGPAQAQEEPQLRFTTRALQVGVGGRVQTLFSTTTGDGAAPMQWEMRRVRVDFAVRANTLLSARIQPEFAGTQVELRDAFLQFDVDPGLQVRVGQAFRPFSLLAQTSSLRVLPIERGARIRGLPAAAQEHYNLVAGLGYADRDVGLQLRGSPRGAPLNLGYGVGLFNGPLFGLAGGNLTYQLAGRLTVAPLPDVTLGFGASRRDFGRADPNGGTIEIRRGHAWQADLEVGSFDRGPHLMAEAALGDQNPLATTPRRFRAAQVWTAYRTRPRGELLTQLEPTLRASFGDVDVSPVELNAGAGGGILVTPGFNVYIGPLNRVMVNYEIWNPRGPAAPVGSLKAMFQMAF